MTIVSDDAVLHGQPRIEGTRVGVLHVYDMVVSGAEPAEVADSLDLALARVYEALAYYYDNPEEMRTVRNEQAEALDGVARRSVDPPAGARDAR